MTDILSIERNRDQVLGPLIDAIPKTEGITAPEPAEQEHPCLASPEQKKPVGRPPKIPEDLKPLDVPWDMPQLAALEWFIWHKDHAESEYAQQIVQQIDIKLKTEHHMNSDQVLAIMQMASKFSDKDKLTNKGIRKHALVKLAEIYPDIHRIRRDENSESSIYASFKPEEGWMQINKEDIEITISQIVSDVIKGNQSLVSATREGLAEVKKYMIEGGVITEWNNSNKSIPFSEGGRSISLEKHNCGVPIATPMEHKMLLRSSVTEEQFMQSEQAAWQETLDLYFGSSDDERQMQKTLQVALGQGIAGNPAQIIPILYGDGANGKSAFIKAMRAALGDFAKTMDADYFIRERNAFKSNNHPQELFKLHRLKMTFIGEMPRGAVFNEDRIKKYSGNDAVESRELYHGSTEFDVPGVNVFYGNHRPKIQFDDAAMQRRLLMFHFKNTIPMDKRMTDNELKDKMNSMRGAIMQWLIIGLRTYYKSNVIPMSSIVEQDTHEYFEEGDWHGGNLKQILVPMSDANARGASLPTILQRLKDEFGGCYKDMERVTKLMKIMAERDYKIETDPGSTKTKYVLGYELADDESAMQERMLELKTNNNHDIDGVINKIDKENKL